MSEKNEYPDNIIRVNFKKKPDDVDMKALYPDAFAMYVDSESENPDDFSKAALEAAKIVKGNKNDDKCLKVYGAKWCPHCTQTVEYLNAQNIEFQYYEIEEQPQEVIQKVIKANGGDDWVVPTLELDGKWREGKIYNELELKSDLQKLGLEF